MKLRTLMITFVALLPLTAGAATFIVPAVASTSNASGAFWKSELTLHSTSNRALDVTLTFHDQLGGEPESIVVSVPAHATRAFENILSAFHPVDDDAIGALEVSVADADANRLSIASRTFNVLPNGRLGQDVPAVAVADAIKAGEVGVIAGPTSATDFRFNAGVYATSAANVRWELIREDGSIAATQTRDYTAGTQNQFSVPLFFGAALQQNDVVHANVVSGSAVFYGSIINNATGDPAFVPFVRNREQSRITLLGVDRDLNGTIDIGAHDNVLDAPIESNTWGYPTFFRIVTDSTGATYEILSSTADATLLDENGQIVLGASSALKGTTGELKVRVTTTDGQSTVLTIPVRFV